MRVRSTNIEVKKNNRNRIFRYICRNGGTSNPDIAYALKVSLPTVTQNTKELAEKGLIEEVGELQSTGGRRAKALAVAKNAQYAAGVDITKNHIGLLLTNLTGEILKYDRIGIAYQESEQYYDTVNERLEQFLEKSMIDRDKLLGIGISVPGIVDLEKRSITYSHALNIQSVPFKNISKYFALPCDIMNDANAAAYAERLRTEGAERFFYLSLSNTVGGALWDSRKLIQGDHFRCGEAGHMTVFPGGDLCYCGKKGCLDAYCSAKVLSRMTDGKLEEFFVLLSKREAAAVAVWDRYTDCLAAAVNNIYMILDCDIILGGYVGSFFEPYLDEMWEKVKKGNTFRQDRCFLRSCSYRIETAALGAAMKIIENFIEQV